MGDLLQTNIQVYLWCRKVRESRTRMLPRNTKLDWFGSIAECIHMRPQLYSHSFRNRS
jgi:hypothetical protein